MAYDILWQCSFLDIDGNRNFVNVRDRDYTGPIVNVRGGASPIVVKLNGSDKDIYHPVDKTQAVLQFVSETKQQFIECKTGDGRRFKVEWIRQLPSGSGEGTVDVTEWQGWIATDLYSEQYVQPTKYIVSIICHDGLGDLETIDYDPLLFEAAVNNFDKVGWKYYLTQILKLTDLDLSIDGEVGINAEDSGTATFDDFASTSAKGFGDTHCFDVLEQLMRSAGAKLRQNRGMWTIFVPNDKARSSGVAPRFRNAKQELAPLPAAKNVQVNAGYRYIDFGLDGWQSWKRYDTGTAMDDVLSGWQFNENGQNIIDAVSITDEGVEIPVGKSKHVYINNIDQDLNIAASNTQNFVFGIEIDFRFLQKAVVRVSSPGDTYVLTTDGWKTPNSGNSYGDLELVPSSSEGGTEQFKITSQPIPFSGKVEVSIKIYAYDTYEGLDEYTGGLAILKDVNITLLDNLADSRTAEIAETTVNANEKEIYSIETALASIDKPENYAARYCGFVYNENAGVVSSKFRLKNTTTAYYSLQQLLLLMYAKTYADGPYRIKCDMSSHPNGFSDFNDLISDDGKTYMLLEGSLDCRSREWSNCTFGEITEGIAEGLTVDASLRTDASGNTRSTGANNEYRVYSFEAGVGKRIRDLDTASAIDLNTLFEVDAVGFGSTKKVALSAIADIVKPDLTGYATEQWVLDKNYALKTDLHTHDNKIVLDALDFNGNYLERNGGEVWVANADRLGNVVAADYYNKYNSNLPTVNWEMADAIVNGTFRTKSFAPGIVGGVGGRMDQAGHAEMQSLIVREFIKTPELIKNRVSVANNEFWFTDPGIIEDVSGTGPYTITYKIEEGDGVTHKADDILIGIFNDGNGFETAYFDVVSVDLANNQAVLNSRNEIAPSKYMVLARKGNKTDTDRQTSVFVDGLNGYMRVLGGVNDHNTDFSNIIAQIGYLNMHSAVFGDMDKGIYVNGGGWFENVKVSGEIYVTGGNAATTNDLALVDTKADNAYNLADLKITDAEAVTITHREITAPYIGTLGLKVGDEILMGENAVISWEKVTGGQAAIDAIEVGGVNLIDNSKTERWSNAYGFSVRTVSLKAGKYVLTAQGKCDAQAVADGKTLKTYFHKNDWSFSTEMVVASTIEITKNSMVITIPDDGEYSISNYMHPNSGSRLGKVYLDWLKLEIGNKSTDWSPSPSDVDTGINNAQLTADSAQSLAESKTDAWVTTITQNTVTAPFIQALSLKVGNEITMGPNAVISWDKVTDNENVETITGSQSKADAAESSAISAAATDATNKANTAENNATAVANAAQNKADSAYSLADTKITIAEATVITQDTVTAPFIAGLSLQVGDEIAMGANAVIAWDKVTGGQAAIDAVQVGGVNLIDNSKTEQWSSNYGFAGRSVTLKAGQYTLSAQGKCDAQAIADGKYLRVYIYKTDWSWSLSISVATTTDTTRGNAIFDIPTDGTYGISSFMYPGGGNRTGKVFLEWMKLEIGSKATDWTPSYSDVDDNVTTITNNTISTTNVIAESLQVRAANILDQLSADKIDVNSLVVKNLKTAPLGKRIEIDADDNRLTFHDSDGFLKILIDDYIWGSKPGMKLYDGVIYIEDGAATTRIDADAVVTPNVQTELCSISDNMFIGNDATIQMAVSGVTKTAYTSSGAGVFRHQIEKFYIKNGLIYAIDMV